MQQISAQEFADFSGYIHEMTGIVISREKAYLLESRLRPLVAAHGFGGFGELYLAARAGNGGELTKEIIDAITTNETFFFRDKKPFELLRNKILPDIIDRRRRAGGMGRIPLRIWSAACSSGQEVYSIAMTLAEMLPVREYDIRILGSDISNKALAAASYGQYSAFDVQRGLPESMRDKYFLPGAGSALRVRDELRAMVRFEKINLLQPLMHQEKFDVIFCRNVAIYFSRPDKEKLFGNLRRMLQPDGALLLGGSETLAGMETGLVSRNYLQGIYYQSRDFVETAAPSPQKAGVPSSPHQAMASLSFPRAAVPRSADERTPAPPGLSPRHHPAARQDVLSSPDPEENGGGGEIRSREGVPAAVPDPPQKLLDALGGGGGRYSGSLLSSLLNTKTGAGREEEAREMGEPASLLAGIRKRHLAQKPQSGDQEAGQERGRSRGESGGRDEE
ncbi:CheR family methyltransferase [Thiovibrio sp. JS02]